MSGVKISQIRWPVELYEWLQDLAYKKRLSMNKTVVQLVEAMKNHGLEGIGAGK